MSLRTFPLALTSLALLALIGSVACSGGGGTQANADVTNGTDTTVGVDTAVAVDTTPAVDTGPDLTPDYPAHCTKTGFAPVSERYDITNGVAGYSAVSTDREPYDRLGIEIYGSFGGATSPGTYDLSYTNYATCGDCVVGGMKCQNGSCAKRFYADEGKLVITEWSWDTGFKGYFEDVVLKEVTINSQTYESTPVQGGTVWCVDAYQFDAEMPQPIVGGENTQPTCVAEGTGSLVLDNVADFELTNCNGETMSLHSNCGQSKALWLIGTAGWCEACTDLIHAIADDHGGSLSRATIAAKTPGLDMLVLLGEDQYGEQPSQSYCASYAKSHNLDPAMVFIDHTDAEVEIPLVDPEGFAIGVNSFGNTWQRINPYLVSTSDGGVIISTPWLALLRGTNMEYIWSQDSQTGFFEAELDKLLAE